MSALGKIINNELLKDSEIHRTLMLPKEFRSNGFIYVLSNQSMQGIYKIGMTIRNVEERVKELSRSTSIPTPFKIEAVFHSENPFRDEQDIHQALAEFRVSEGREFFRCELQDILDCCREFTQLFRVGEDLAETATRYDLINLDCNAEPLDNDDVFYLLKDIDYLGNEVAIQNLLCDLGAEVLCKFIKEKNLSVVIMPFGEIEFVKSLAEQDYQGESGNE